MCGICGWVIPEGPTTLTCAALKQMVSTLNHRGPDDTGYWLDDHIALGHKRLSIIDLEGGRQPMRGRLNNVIVFNGEIYNYLELREQLRQSGFCFQTTSDTEVLLAAYEAWGEQCLEKLVGMFSFAIWDPKDKKLFVARDRLGKKPFYYYHGARLFAFASELKALLTLPEIRHSIEIDALAVSDYLSLGYILSPKTIFERVRKLPAAHYATYKVDSNRLTFHKYWSLEEFFLADKSTGNRQETTSAFFDVFQSSVKMRMRSDVPLGAFLSGGIDSSSVVATMRQLSETPLRAYCVGFSEPSYDESRYAKLLAKQLDVDLQVGRYRHIVDTELSRLIWHFDEPFCDTSFIPTYQLNQLTRRFATVSLSGDGADEILAGYPTIAADRFYRLYAELPIALQKLCYQTARRALSPSYKKVSWDYKLLRFLSSYGLSNERAHYWWRTIFSEDEKKRIMSPALLSACKGYDPFDGFMDYFREVSGAHFLDQTLYVDIKTWLQDDILVKVDRMSMANSVEVRSPFLDHRLVEFTARLPVRAKQNGGRQKVILRNAMKGVLPRETLLRSKKGFNAPHRPNGRTTSLKTRHASELFLSDYRLDPNEEDITFKEFSFSVLAKWLDIFHQYQSTGKWQHVEYDG